MKIVTIVSAAFAAALLYSPASAATMNICSGKQNGNYDYTAQMVKAYNSKVEINVVNTAGSLENIQKLQSGECDAALVQSDAEWTWEKEKGPLPADPLSDVYREYVHLLCNRDSGIEQFSDLNEKTKVMIGKEGSGSQVTWRGLVLADKENGGDVYSKIPVIYDGGSKKSLVDLSAKKNGATCMFYVGTPGATFMTNEAQNFADKLVLVPVVDKDFNDIVSVDDQGNESSVYTPATLSYDSYTKIMPSGVFGRSDVDTIAVTAKFFVSKKWADNPENEDAYGDVGYNFPEVLKALKVDKNLSME